MAYPYKTITDHNDHNVSILFCIVAFWRPNNGSRPGPFRPL